MAERRTIAIGDLLEGTYEVTGELGAGAMGVVYAGRHLTLARHAGSARRLCDAAARVFNRMIL